MRFALEFKPNFAEAVARMRRLWNLQEPLDRIPAVVRVPTSHPKGRKLADGTFFGRVDDYLAYQEAIFRVQAQVPDEWLPIVHPQYGHALISALCGSPIRVESHTVWSVPIIRDWAQVRELHLDWDNEWGRRVQADYERLLEWARGRCGVAVYEVEGVADTMAALRGTEQLCLDYYESPARVDAFAERITDILIEFGRWNNKHIAAPQDLLGGVASDWQIWMPANSIAFTEDASVMYSRALYRRFIRERDRRLSGAFDRTLLEVHAEGNHQIPEFAQVEGVWMLVVQNPLRMRPEHREAVRLLLGRKILFTSCRQEELEDLLCFTGPRGVFITTTAPDVRAARRVLNHLARLTDRLRGKRP